MRAFQFVECAEAAGAARGAGARARAGAGPGEGRGCRCLPLRPAHHGGARTGSRARPKLPFTLGHENAGWVERLGPGVTGFAPGDPVIVYGPWGCGLCANCREGRENYCQTTGGLGGGLGGGHDGGMAEYLLVPASRFLIPLGTLDPREAAPLSRRGADQLSRRQAVAAPAGAGLDRGGDRGGRSGPDGHPDSASAQRGDHRRRRGHRRRQAGDRQAHGRGRGAAFGRPGGHAHQGHDAGSRALSSCWTWSA